MRLFWLIFPRGRKAMNPKTGMSFKLRAYFFLSGALGVFAGKTAIANDELSLGMALACAGGLAMGVAFLSDSDPH